MRAGQGYPDSTPESPLESLTVRWFKERQMIWCRAAAVFGFVLLFNSAGRAEEPNAELPPDGWWVQYLVTTKTEFKDGRSVEQTEKCRFSLVGTVTENGMKCRWVEMKSPGKVRVEEHVQITKLLFPEKDLLESGRPLNSLKRWRRQNHCIVIEGTGRVNLLFTDDLLIFPGLRQNTEIIDEQKVIEYQQRRLQIAQGRKGTDELKVDVVRGGQAEILTYNFEFTVWHHSAVPLGFVAAKTRRTSNINDVLQSSRDAEWVIDDFGTGATSESPE